MLDLKFVLANLPEIRERLFARGVDSQSFELLADLDRKRREQIAAVEVHKQSRNELSKKIGPMIKAGEDASELREKVRVTGDEIKSLDEAIEAVESSIREVMQSLPNVPATDVPVGADESQNREERVVGDKPTFAFEPKDHVEIGESAGLIDFERAARMTGSRFVVSFALAARLERALTQFMLDLHVEKHGYTEVAPPFIVNRDSLFGTGQLPKFEDDLFKLAKPDDWYLIPTAEVPLTNLHREEILDESDLPLRYTAYTPCFRSEAGSYGRDTRGMIRQHQFNKVELVMFAHPERSTELLEQLTADAEAVLQRLGLHYRVVSLCTGDLGFSAAKTYDLEVWLPSQNRFREISSCSCFTDFQARRANVRFRPTGGGKPKFVHTLNGSGLAVGRTVVALLENFQREDGSFDVPDALGPYMQGRL